MTGNFSVSRRGALRIGVGGAFMAGAGVLGPAPRAAADGRSAPGESLAGSFNAINITRAPAFVNEFDTPQGKVPQCAVKDTATGHWFVSEPTEPPPTDGSPPDCVISRHRADGVYVSLMTLSRAGHGTAIALQHDGSTLYVWISWGSTLVRLPYAGGATRVLGDAQVMNKFTSMYAIPSIDEYSDLLTLRLSNSTTVDTVVKRRLSDVMAGVDNVLAGPWDVPTGGHAFQGFCDYGDTFFMLYGASNANDDVLKQFRWSDGAPVRSTDISAVGGSATYHEPEGVSLFRDGTGRATVAFCIVDKVGSTFRRRLYSWTESGDLMNQEIRNGKRVVPVGTATTAFEVPVAFKLPFDAPPVVLVSQSSGGDFFYHAGSKSITANGFTLVVNKSGPSGSSVIRAEWAALPNTGG